MEVEMSLGDDQHTESPSKDLAVVMYPHPTDEGTGVQRLQD